MENFIFTKKQKTASFILLGVGILLFFIGVALELSHDSGEGHGHGAHDAVNRIWTGLYINSMYFFGIGLGAIFFLAVQYASQAAYSVVFKRMLEAMSTFMPYAAVFMLLVWLAGSFHLHHIFHWMADGIADPDSVHYDEVIAGKTAYLNQPFFYIRAIVFLGAWIFLGNLIIKKGRESDNIAGNGNYAKNITISAIFLVIFGYTSLVASWDWIMSIDTHWFSTMYGWYYFSGVWITSMVVLTAMTIYLKGLGYLPQINRSHMQDLGKWVFGVSFLWSYLFFCQFMLIWYSNIPEEVTYFLIRFEDYKFMFWATFAINFIVPMLLLMDKESKRNRPILLVMCAILFIGHWMDTYMMISPGVMKGVGAQIGFIEIGGMLAFAGLLLMVVFKALTKAPLVVKNHPYLDESLHHHIN